MFSRMGSYPAFPLPEPVLLPGQLSLDLYALVQKEIKVKITTNFSVDEYADIPLRSDAQQFILYA